MVTRSRMKRIEEIKPKIMFAVGGVNVSPAEFMKRTKEIISKVHPISGYEMEFDDKGRMKKKRRLF